MGLLRVLLNGVSKLTLPCVCVRAHLFRLHIQSRVYPNLVSYKRLVDEWMEKREQLMQRATPTKYLVSD